MSQTYRRRGRGRDQDPGSSPGLISPGSPATQPSGIMCAGLEKQQQQQTIVNNEKNGRTETELNGQADRMVMITTLASIPSPSRPPLN